MSSLRSRSSSFAFPRSLPDRSRRPWPVPQRGAARRRRRPRAARLAGWRRRGRGQHRPRQHRPRAGRAAERRRHQQPQHLPQSRGGRLPGAAHAARRPLRRRGSVRDRATPTSSRFQNPNLMPGEAVFLRVPAAETRPERAKRAGARPRHAPGAVPPGARGHGPQDHPRDLRRRDRPHRGRARPGQLSGPSRVVFYTRSAA